MIDQDLLARITSSPHILAGEPTIRGTRLSVEFILNSLAHGATEAGLLTDYQGLAPEDLAACFLFASKCLKNTSSVFMAEMGYTQERVAAKVRERLQNVSVSGITMEVGESGIQKVDDWWRVPIRPSRWPRRMSDFYEDLANVEDDLQEQEHLNILMATGEPLEEDEEVGAVAA